MDLLALQVAQVVGVELQMGLLEEVVVMVVIGDLVVEIQQIVDLVVRQVKQYLDLIQIIK